MASSPSPPPRFLLSSQRVWNTLRESLRDAVGLVLPTWCVVCGTENRSVCGACRETIVYRENRRSIPVVDRAGAVRELWVCSAVAYEGNVRRILLAVKEGRSDASGALAPLLRRVLGDELARLYRSGASAGRVIRVVPMPSTARSERLRGFRPVELLVRSGSLCVFGFLEGAWRQDASRRVRLKRWLRVRRRRRKNQVGLSRTERQRNVDETLVASYQCATNFIVIVDDVITTGSSLRESYRALSEKGGIVLGAVTLAHTPRHPV
ncbi:phosphoribosyltransferase family protein [Lysinibacter sp. HNR]|uniref:ComF family protein n=1 Tax=Lysinibacter sp. HNR TaxID=3031408 RepID=UPI002435E96E|nr:phosphoribosyltransferase family protein [Lysinibacter sp. HNR]WGD38039.1 phosphoribosyltransferase family protein [Lysinibacter sp. HNR]